MNSFGKCAIIEATIIFIIFWDFLLFYQLFFTSQVIPYASDYYNDSLVPSLPAEMKFC